MRAGGSKQKGAHFERDVCKRLSLWVSGGEREDLFWRSAMSGGRATVGRRQGKDLAKHSGDVSATHPMGHSLTDYWYIECKHVASLDLESAMLSDAGRLVKFWRVACREAAEHKLMPMIIAKQNRSQIMLIVPRGTLINPAGVSPFPWAALIAKFKRLECDIFDFERVLAKPFPSGRIAPDYKWLKPGELARILAAPQEPVPIYKHSLPRAAKRKGKRK